MAYESDEWPYSLFYQNRDNYPCYGSYAIFEHLDTVFCMKHNDQNYVSKIPVKYTKLSDRELTEW